MKRAVDADDVRQALQFVALLCILGTAPAAAMARLPDGLNSPDHGVVCDNRRGACFDRFGPSIGLTEVFLGAGAAQTLTAALRGAPVDRSPDAEFSPADGTACRRETGPCRSGGVVEEALTAVLYGSRPAASPAIGVDWQWLASRYSDGREARPADPARYRLRLEANGSLAARLDCNSAGGRYLIDDGAITIGVTHSTRATCEPGSLDQAFQRDLGAAAGYSVRQGRLYLDLKQHAGTMEFSRP